MSNPSDNIEITKGATLRDHTETVLKNGGPLELMDMSIGQRKMSLQTYKLHKESQIRLYNEDQLTVRQKGSMIIGDHGARGNAAPFSRLKPDSAQ